MEPSPRTPPRPRRRRYFSPTLAEQFRRACLGPRDEGSLRELENLAAEVLPVVVAGALGTSVPVRDPAERRRWIRALYGDDLCLALGRYLAAAAPGQIAAATPELPPEMWAAVMGRAATPAAAALGLASRAMAETYRPTAKTRRIAEQRLLADYLRRALDFASRWLYRGRSPAPDPATHPPMEINDAVRDVTYLERRRPNTRYPWAATVLSRAVPPREREEWTAAVRDAVPARDMSVEDDGGGSAWLTTEGAVRPLARQMAYDPSLAVSMGPVRDEVFEPPQAGEAATLFDDPDLRAVASGEFYPRTPRGYNLLKTFSLSQLA